MNTFTSLPGAKTSPTIFAATSWQALTIVYVSPTDSEVSVRNSVLTSICRTPGDCEYHAPEISCRLDQAGSPP